MNSLKTLRTRWKISDLENIFRTGTGEVMSVSHRSLCTNITQYRHIQQLQRKNKSYDLQLNNGGLEKADFQQRRYNLAKLLASSNPVLHRLVLNLAIWYYLVLFGAIRYYLALLSAI